MAPARDRKHFASHRQSSRWEKRAMCRNPAVARPCPSIVFCLNSPRLPTHEQLSCRRAERGKPCLSKHKQQRRKRFPKNRCLNLFCNGKDAFKTFIIQLRREERGKRKNRGEKKAARRQRERSSSLGGFQRGASRAPGPGRRPAASPKEEPGFLRGPRPQGRRRPTADGGPGGPQLDGGLTAAPRGPWAATGGSRPPPSRRPARRPRRPARVLT